VGVTGVEGQVWYLGWEVPRMLLLCFTKEKYSTSRPTHKRYYATRVFKHWYWRTAMTQDITLNW